MATESVLGILPTLFSIMKKRRCVSVFGVSEKTTSELQCEGVKVL